MYHVIHSFGINNIPISYKAHDISFDEIDEHSISPLSRAAAHGDLRVVSRLLKKGRLPQAPDNRGWCAVHAAVGANQTRSLRFILNFKKGRKKYLANIRTWQGETPLIIASKNEPISLAVLRTLLKSGANPKLTTNEGMTALHYVCKQKGSYSAAKLLVEYGAVVDAIECLGGYTPLHFAIIEAADIKLVRYLADNGDVNLADYDMETPLNKACVCNFTQAAKYILSKDTSSVNVMPKGCFSSLSAAALNGNLRISRLLLNADADTSIKGPAGFHREELCQYSFLPIHSSVLAGSNVFKLFLEKMDPATLKQYEDRTLIYSLPVYTMMYAPSPKFFEILLQHDFPEEYMDLKRVDLTKLAYYLLGVEDFRRYIIRAKAEKFKLFFKYCSNFEPDNIFDYFVSLVTGSQHEFLKRYYIFYVLARMGLSSERVFKAKRKLITLLYEVLEPYDEKEVILEIISLLNQQVTTLKQMSRVASRRFIHSVVKDDWTAYELIRDSSLPATLKEYLWYQDFKLNCEVDFM